MGREVEKGMLFFIINQAKKNNVKRLKAKFIPTPKNKPIEDFLPNCKFHQENDFWIYNLETPFNMPDFLTLREE